MGKRNKRQAAKLEARLSVPALLEAARLLASMERRRPWTTRVDWSDPKRVQHPGRILKPAHGHRGGVVMELYCPSMRALHQLEAQMGREKRSEVPMVLRWILVVDVRSPRVPRMETYASLSPFFAAIERSNPIRRQRNGQRQIGWLKVATPLPMT
jgi:hypothetical protein